MCLNYFKKKWIDIIVIAVIIALIVGFIGFLLYPVLKEKVDDFIGPKPKLLVNFEAYKKIDLSTLSEPYLNKLYLATSFNKKKLIILDLSDAPNLSDLNQLILFNYLDKECLFASGEPCYYNSIEIHNVGTVPVKEIELAITTSSPKIEFTKEISPIIELSNNTGFLLEKGISLRIRELEINQSAGVMIKLSQNSSASIKCRINGKEDFCIKSLIEFKQALVTTPSITRIDSSGKSEDIDVSKIPSSFDFVLYEWDELSKSFIKISNAVAKCGVDNSVG